MHLPNLHCVVETDPMDSENAGFEFLLRVAGNRESVPDPHRKEH